MKLKIRISTGFLLLAFFVCNCSRIVMSSHSHSRNNKTNKLCYMPDGCYWSSNHLHCDKLYASFDMKEFGKMSHTICTPKNKHESISNFHFNGLSKNLLVLNNSFDLSYMIKYSKQTYQYFTIHFYRLKGIQIDLKFSFADFYSNEIIYDNFKYRWELMWEFSDIDFNIFSKSGSLIRTCQDFIDSAPAMDSKNVFWENTILPIKMYSDFPRELHLKMCRFPTPVCPILFQNARLIILQINGLIR